MGKGKPSDDNAPKRPLSGFFLFAGEVRPKIMKANPDFMMGDVGKEIGKQWSALSESTKAPYQAKAEKLKTAYQSKMGKYKKTASYTKHQAALEAWKKEQASKPFKKDPNRPKRGLSAYIIFGNEQRPKLDKEGLAVTEMMKKTGVMWGKLSEAQKAPYVKKAAKSKADADKAMEKYKKTKDFKNYMAEKEAYDAKKSKQK